jgi:hypothetical protein
LRRRQNHLDGQCNENHRRPEIHHQEQRTAAFTANVQPTIRKVEYSNEWGDTAGNTMIPGLIVGICDEA